MSMVARVKGWVERLPEGVGRPLAYVPFTCRLGGTYAGAARSIERSQGHVDEATLLRQLRAMLCHAAGEVEFYREFYRAHGFSALEIKTLDDWSHVPVVTKTDLQEAPLTARLARGQRGMCINTGGTSGQPLEFHLDSQAFAREWAHMHKVWKLHGYSPRHLKLTFRGRHFDASQPLRYNAVHNEYIVNASVPMERVVDAVLALPRTSLIRWLHGYPSLVAEFAHALGARDAGAQSVFRGRLYGSLLGSEYPAPAYRDVIEGVLSANVVSWYGHSEMAVLARETSRGVYTSFPTYGYAEAVYDEATGQHRLVCTSLHNHVHPFIRYDTGDLIEPVSQVGGALSFRITEGRVGDFIHDRHGKRHSLTAIIFGRHHAAFSLMKHLQVREDSPGNVSLVLTPKDASVGIDDLRQSFDLDDLDIHWRIELVDEPVRTQAGKVKLKIS